MAQKENNSENIKISHDKIAYVVSHTHWDREWRYPLWPTRMLLVDFMDELIDVLEKEIYPGFLLDGQVSPIYDYLEIRPEMKDRIVSLVKAGKLEIGPWYTLPDEFPVDGECMVRNLLLGYRKAKDLGKVLGVGYTSFGWGQTAQLPQIYSGFDIKVAMVGKRVSAKRAPKSEFLWQSPDGTILLTTRFGDLGRQNMYLKVHMSALTGMDHESSQWNYDWSQGGIAFHFADREKMEQDHVRLDSPVDWHREYLTPQLVEELWRTTDQSVLKSTRLMMNGCDYSASQPMFRQILEQIQKIDPDKKRKWIHTTISKFAEVMYSEVDSSKLKIVKGELKDGPAINITGNALATHMDLKQLNKKAQNFLIRVAEPMMAMAEINGIHISPKYLDYAWSKLLESQAHDSINGVTQDVTVLDVKARLREVANISEAVAHRAMQEFVKNIDMSNFDDNDVLLIVFNSLPYNRREIIEAWINTPRDKQYSYLIAPPDGLQIYDAQGKALDTQWEGVEDESYPVAEMHARAFPFYCRRHRVFFDTEDIPAGGYKIFKVSSIDYENTSDTEWTDSISRTSTILKGPYTLENEYLHLEINPNGTFDLIDKRSGRKFEQLNYYLNSGEQGNYWVNKKPMFNKTYSSRGCSAEIWSEENGPLQATLASRITLSLPEHISKAGSKRSNATVEMKITTKVTLRKGQDFVEVGVNFENRHKDHYLKVMFPTGISKAEYTWSGGHFTVDKRAIRPQGPTEKTVWPDMGTLPQNNFIDINDGNYGLAFINDSFTEYEVIDNEERTVAFSLLRSVKNWICTERIGSDYPSQKQGQCLGEYNYRYAIKPHTGSCFDADIPTASMCFNIPLQPVQTRRHQGRLPQNMCKLFEIENRALQFSALKKAEDRDTFVLRLYNPAESEQDSIISFNRRVEKVWLANLNEKRIKELSVAKNGCVSIVADPQKILTIEFSVDN